MNWIGFDIYFDAIQHVVFLELLVQVWVRGSSMISVKSLLGFHSVVLPLL